MGNRRQPLTSKCDFERVKSTYTVREISRHFGLSERLIRRWTREGLIHALPSDEQDDLRYDFVALTQFRRLRVLRAQGLTRRQIEADLRGQLSLFPEHEGELISLQRRLSPFEEALLYDERGDLRAAEAYRKAISEDDCVADAYCNLGMLELEDGRITKAFDCFTQALTHEPRHFESHYNLANLYLDEGDARLARLHYEIAAELEPSFPNIYFNLGLAHALNKERDAAITALRKYRNLVSEEEARHADELLASLEKGGTCS